MESSSSDVTNAQPWDVTIECLLEINRPELTYYLFAGGDPHIGSNFIIPHFEMNDHVRCDRGGEDPLVRPHDIPKRFPIISPVTFDNGRYRKGRADNIVVNHRFSYMSRGYNLQRLPLEDVALIEKAMRIGLSAFGAQYSCDGCEGTFKKYGLDHALTIDITKVAM